MDGQQIVVELVRVPGGARGGAGAGAGAGAGGFRRGSPPRRDGVTLK